MVFITIGYAIKSNDHVRITFLKTVLPAKWQLILDLFSVVCFMIFAVLCMGPSVKIIRVMVESGQMAATMPNFPLWLLYLSMPICIIDIVFRGIQASFKIILEFSEESTPEIMEEK